MKLGKVLIIDGSNLIHRQLSQPELWELSFQGKRTGAVFGFFRSLIVTLNRYPGYYPIVVFDKGRSERRLLLYPNYKHTEDAKADAAKASNASTVSVIMPNASPSEYVEELMRQSEVIKGLLGIMKVPVVSVRGWEGDDIMAIISRFTENGVIVTDDKDLYQLISEHIQIFRPIRVDENGNRGEVITFDKVKHPIYNDARSYVIHKAIVGDPSDNIPKVAHGIGEKRAETLTDYILSANEDPAVYIPSMAAMPDPYFHKFVENHVQFLINMQLIDLKIIPNDPLILSELSEQLKSCQELPSLITVITQLSMEGIKAFDYTKLISHVVMTQQEVKDYSND